jgi:hypothetical protein
MIDPDLVDQIPQKGRPWWMSGKPVNWGGKRKGAGRPTTKKKGVGVVLSLNPIQLKLLIEYGNGELEKGLEKLVNENF